MNKKKVITGLTAIVSGQAFGYGLSFLRNMILARMLTKADFGLAAVFALAVGMMELIGRMSLGRQVVQAEEGNTRRFLNTAHLFQMMAGLLSALLLVLFAVPAATIFKVPDKAWVFALLGLVPLFRGLENLDFERRQRAFEFLPAFWIQLVPQFIVTALAWPLILLMGDFRVIIVLILMKSLLTLLMTHIISQSPYRWGWEKSLVKGMWRFSWPLIVNGLLMYASQEGDKFLVGAGYSLEVLAIYSGSALLISAPFMIMANTSSSFILPLLSRCQKNIESFNREYRACLEISSLIAIVAMIPFIISGEHILTLVFGAKYQGGGPLMAILAAACAFRFLRIAPSTAAMSRADTKNNLLTNMIRVVSFFLGLGVISFNGSIEMMAGCMLIGEMIALGGSFVLLKYRLDVPFSGALKVTLYTGISLMVALVFTLFTKGETGMMISFGISIITISSCAISAGWVFPENARRCIKEVKVFMGGYA